MFHIRSISALVALGLFVTSLGGAQVSQQQQDTAARSSLIETLKVDHGAAKWRDAPINVASQHDSAKPSIREARNAYWDMRLPPTNGTLNPPTYFRRAPELPPMESQHDVWVIATFTSYGVYEPYDKRGPYTEVHFTLNSVIITPVGLTLVPSQVIDVGEVGGTIRRLDGSISSSNLHLDQFAFQPGHKYLLMLSYNETAAFYTVRRRWDVTSGTALPSGEVEANAFVDHRSLIGGLTSDDAIQYIKSSLVNRR